MSAVPDIVGVAGASEQEWAGEAPFYILAGAGASPAHSPDLEAGMSNTTAQIIGLTFGLIALIWILTKSDAFKTVVSSIGGVYSQSVGALMPKQ